MIKNKIFLLMKEQIVSAIREIQNLESNYIPLLNSQTLSNNLSLIEEILQIPDYCFKEVVEVTSQFGSNNQYVMF